MENIFDETLKIESARISSNLFELSLEEMNRTRKDKPEQFINFLINYIKSKPAEKDANYLFHRLKVTADELKAILEVGIIISTNEEKVEIFHLLYHFLIQSIPYIAESGEIGNSKFLKLSVTERRKQLEKMKFSDKEIAIIYQYFRGEITIENKVLSSIRQKFSVWNESFERSFGHTEPSGEALLMTALHKIKAEKNYKKPSDLYGFVERRIKKTFPDKTKPYTDEQFKYGVEWGLKTREKNLDEKIKRNPQAQKKTNIKATQWKKFLLQIFADENYKFAHDFKKVVNTEIRKILKDQNARSLTKR